MAAFPEKFAHDESSFGYHLANERGGIDYKWTTREGHNGHKIFTGLHNMPLMIIRNNKM